MPNKSQGTTQLEANPVQVRAEDVTVLVRNSLISQQSGNVTIIVTSTLIRSCKLSQVYDKKCMESKMDPNESCTSLTPDLPLGVAYMRLLSITREIASYFHPEQEI